MSNDQNTTLNAVLALIEGRTEAAREMLRSPSLKVASVSDVVTRIQLAIDQAIRTQTLFELRRLLQRSMMLNPSSTNEDHTAGIAEVEQLIEERIQELTHDQADVRKP